DLPPSARAVAIALTALVALSALVRGIPPEANWWAPAALVMMIAAAPRIARRRATHRVAIGFALVAPTLIASAHALRPFLPLSLPYDPAARLHGWSRGAAPIQAAGVGRYGPPAEQCVYADDCDAIDSILNKNQ